MKPNDTIQIDMNNICDNLQDAMPPTWTFPPVCNASILSGAMVVGIRQLLKELVNKDVITADCANAMLNELLEWSNAQTPRPTGCDSEDTIHGN